MAAKRVDPLKAKQAKQKKIAIVGGVLLLGILGFQGPKTLKMLKGPQPVTPPAAATPTAPATPSPGVAAPPAAGGVATPAAPATELASVPDSDAAPEAEQGQLATFERFASKDPVAQQAEPVSKPPRVAKPSEGKKAAPKPVEKKPAAGGFTAGDAATSPAELATATSIAVNGLAEDVAVEAAFPAAEPTFVLVSIAKDGKSVELGIAGGSYAGGGETMKLKLGQKITLQNTADGSRYELELLSIQGFPLPKKK